MVLALAVAFGLAGSSFAEYRLLYAVASLPHTEGAATLNLDCPTSTGKASERPEVALTDDALTPRVPLLLPGIRCTIPLSPD